MPWKTTHMAPSSMQHSGSGHRECFYTRREGDEASKKGGNHPQNNKNKNKDNNDNNNFQVPNLLPPGRRLHSQEVTRSPEQGEADRRLVLKETRQV